MSRLNEPQPRVVHQAALTGPEQDHRLDYYWIIMQCCRQLRNSRSASNDKHMEDTYLIFVFVLVFPAETNQGARLKENRKSESSGTTKQCAIKLFLNSIQYKLVPFLPINTVRPLTWILKGQAVSGFSIFWLSYLRFTLLLHIF